MFDNICELILLKYFLNIYLHPIFCLCNRIYILTHGSQELRASVILHYWKVGYTENLEGLSRIKLTEDSLSLTFKTSESHSKLNQSVYTPLKYLNPRLTKGGLPPPKYFFPDTLKHSFFI